VRFRLLQTESTLLLFMLRRVGAALVQAIFVLILLALIWHVLGGSATRIAFKCLGPDRCWYRPLPPDPLAWLFISASAIVAAAILAPITVVTVIRRVRMVGPFGEPVRPDWRPARKALERY
jgi:hypothetical protein